MTRRYGLRDDQWGRIAYLSLSAHTMRNTGTHTVVSRSAILLLTQTIIKPNRITSLVCWFGTTYRPLPQKQYLL